jgi:hypothetical protein
LLDPYWPEAVEVLGPMQGGRPFARCVACGPDEHPGKSGTWVAYGGFPLCRSCALALAVGGGERLPLVTEALRRAIAAGGAAKRGC